MNKIPTTRRERGWRKRHETDIPSFNRDNYAKSFDFCTLHERALLLSMLAQAWLWAYPDYKEKTDDGSTDKDEPDERLLDKLRKYNSYRRRMRENCEQDEKLLRTLNAMHPANKANAIFRLVKFNKYVYDGSYPGFLAYDSDTSRSPYERYYKRRYKIVFGPKPESAPHT